MGALGATVTGRGNSTAQVERKKAGPTCLDALIEPERAVLRSAGLLSALASALWLVQAAAIATGIERLLVSPAAGLIPVMCATVFVLAGVLRAVIDQYAHARSYGAAERIISVQRRRLITAEARRSPLSTAQPASAAVASLMAEKLGMLQPYLLRYTSARIRTLLLPLTIVAVCMTMSWVAALILLVAGPLIPLFMVLVGLAARAASERHLRQIGSLNSLLMERLSALVDIRLLDAGSYTVERFQQAADDLRERTMSVLRVAFLSSTVLELFSAIGVAMMAVYVGFSLLGVIRFGSYDSPLRISEGILLLMLAPDFFQPLRDLAASWHDKAAALAVADELQTLSDSRDPDHDMAGVGKRVTALSGPTRITTHGLFHQASSGTRIDFPDIAVNAGESLAITGPSGSGKSTLLALLAGLARPAGGTITVADCVLDDSSADAWRARCGWLSQTPHFLSGSLRSNLMLGSDTHPPGGIAAALELASASHLVQTLPHGLQARLGENGSGVSGGEARRLMLARAAYSRPDVLFADEPTADLDEWTAGEVVRGLLRLVESGTTLIVATHDPILTSSLQHRVTLRSNR